VPSEINTLTTLKETTVSHGLRQHSPTLSCISCQRDEYLSQPSQILPIREQSEETTASICRHTGRLDSHHSLTTSASEPQSNHPTFTLGCVVKTGERGRRVKLSFSLNSQLLSNRLQHFFPPLEAVTGLLLLLLSGKGPTEKTFTDPQTDPYPNRGTLAWLHSPLLYFRSNLQAESSKPEIVTGIDKQKKKSRWFRASGSCLDLSVNQLSRRQRLAWLRRRG